MTIPRLTHDQAEGVGQELARWLMDRGQLLDMDELSWADAVQLVLRRSAEVQADAEEQAEGNAAAGGASATARPQRAQRSCASSEEGSAEADPKGQ